MSISGLLLGEARRRTEKKEISELRDKVDKQAIRARVRKMVTEWRNSILSDRYAVQDDNWRGLLDRATKWRTGLAGESEKILEHAGGQPTRAFVLLQETAEPAKRFETAIGPIVRRWEAPPANKDPCEDKLLIISAITELQEKFNKVIEQLVDLSDEQLTEIVSATPPQSAV